MLNKDQYTKAYLNLIIKESTNNIDYIKNKEIAAEIGGVYDKETNTIDCKQKQFTFKNHWFNRDGSFDFKLTNLSDDLSLMFIRCKKMRYLPEHFTIPEGVVNCASMFGNCVNLEQLPENFTLPSTLKYCEHMFYDCESLFNISFTLPNGVVDIHEMFAHCSSLEIIIDDFTIPNSVESCYGLFSSCESLCNVPAKFTIPAECDCDDIFIGCDNLTDEQKDVDQYKLLEV